MDQFNGNKMVDKRLNDNCNKNDDKQIDKMNESINNLTKDVHISPASSPSLTTSNSSLNSSLNNSLSLSMNKTSNHNYPVNSTSLNNQSSKLIGNGSNGDADTNCRSNSANSSHSSDLNSPKLLQTQPNVQQSMLNSSYPPFSTFPFFNAFNLLHPILNKHLYSSNTDFNFSPFTSAYLNQLQNVRPISSSPNSAVGDTNNTFAQIGNCSSTIVNSSTTDSTSISNSVLTNSTNPQHALRKGEINSLVSGKFALFFK